MRIIRLTSNYASYLQKFYHRRPGLENKPYSVQYKTLMEDCCANADFWTHALSKLGYEGWDPVGNAEPQQKVWAKEHTLSYNRESWLLDIIAAQVKSFRPDVLFVTDYATYTRDFLNHLRETCPSIRLILGWCGAPYQDPAVFSAYDVVLSNIISLVNHFRNEGHKSELFRHAFDTRILNRIDNNASASVHFSFIGSIFIWDKFHKERARLLKYLARHSNIQIWSDINAPPIDEYRKIMKSKASNELKFKFIKIFGLESFAKSSSAFNKIIKISYVPDVSECVAIEIAEKCNPGIYGLEMYQTLRNSKVTFNNHIDISASHANNMRLYEATGVGTCVLTDWMDDLIDLFEPDAELVTYRSAEEAAEKARYLLEHDSVRKQIGSAGQRRTLKEHTYDLRAIELDKLIRKMI